MAHIPNSEEQFSRMMNTPIPRLVTSLAVPTVISMLVTVIYNTADTYFVSQINKSASAAVGMVYSLMAIIQAVGYGLGMGAGSLISLKLGEKKDDEADMYASSAFLASVLIGAIVGYGGYALIDRILALLKCSDTILPYAKPYAKYILLAAPFSCSSFVLNNALRAEGESRIAMWGLGAGGILNVILDPILIFAADMGTGGAALATAISQIVSFAILLSFFLTGKSIVRLRPRMISRKLSDYWMIVATGLPTICRQGLGSVAATLLNIQAVAYGDAAVSAITKANKVYVLVRNIVIGIGQGFNPVAGYNYSAGNKKRAWNAFTFATALGTVICVISAALISIFANPIMWWFCSDAEVAKIGVETLYYVCAVMPFLAFSTLANQLYQCLGFKAPATFLASCRQGIFFIPCVFILPLFLDCKGVQMSQAATDFLTFVISIPFIVYFYRHIIRENQKTNC